MKNLRTRAIGLLATLAIIALVLAAPIALVAIGAAPWDLSITQIFPLLRAPDDGHLAGVLVAATAWAAWAAMSFAFAIEIVSHLRNVEAPRVPVLALPQRFARRLVTVASLLFVAVPTVGPAAATPRTPPPDHVAAVRLVNEATAEPKNSATDSNHPGARSTDRTDENPTIEHTVKPGETLWRIAERQLGDGSRWRVIFERNQDILGDTPDFIRPGTVIRIPKVDDPRTETTQYVVRPGDTLSGIAQRTLGDPSRFGEIFEASQDLVQSTGTGLTDPDLILPGWRLTVPTTSEAETPGPVPGGVPDIASKDPAATPNDDSESASARQSAPANEAHQVAPTWLVPGLAGAGALLAGGLLLTLRSQVRLRLRYREPGQVLSPLPKNLLHVEKSVHTFGAASAKSLTQVHRLLNQLADATQDDPSDTCDLLFAELSSDTLTLHLTEPCELADPWEGEGTTWSASLDADVEDLDRIPPYPLLVAVGQSSDGHLWLANLQAMGPLALTGDREGAMSLARHISAELILNPWASLVDVDVFGLGDELAPLDPQRLHTHPSADESHLSHLADRVANRSTQEPPERFKAIVSVEPVGNEPLSRLVAGCTPQSGMALIAVWPGDGSGFTEFELSADRTLRTRFSGDLSAAGLTPQEAAACAAIVDVSRLSTPQAPPAVQPSNTSDVEDPRPSSDFQSETRSMDDPGLDRELQAWFDSTSPLPRLTLLGPVGVRAFGDPRAVAKRKPYYTEVLAYLCLNPNGVTSAQFADDFGITTSRARTDINAVRNWLGDNPRTGRRHIPDAFESAAALERGVAAYQVEDLLSDLELFRRLRRRGEARREEGIDDLIQALKLVSGQPFDQLRPGGWAWLANGDHLDHTIACAIVDVAHAVATFALNNDNVELAETVAKTARRAAPHDEIATLDLVAALAAGGHGTEAQKLLENEVFNRRDDELGPTEIPPRTAEILRQHRWQSTRPDH